MKKKIKLTPGIKATLSKRGMLTSTGKESNINDKPKVLSANSVNPGAGISRRIKVSHNRMATKKMKSTPDDPVSIRSIVLAVVAIVLILIILIAMFAY